MKYFLTISILIISSISALSTPVDTAYVKKTYDRAWEFIESGDNTKAIPLLEEIVTIKKNSTADFNPQFFTLYNTLGILYKNQGHFQTALDYYNRALESTNSLDKRASMFGNIGIVCSFLGEYTKAINHYSYALALFEKSQNLSKKNIFIVYNNLGLAYYNAGQWEKSLHYYQKSIQISKDNGFKDLGVTYYNAGLACQKLGKFSEANQYHLLSLRSNSNDYGQGHYKTAMSYIYYAQYLLAVNDLSKSWEYYTKAYQVLSKTVGLKHPYTSTCLMGMGDYCCSRKEYRRALSYYQQSLISKIYSFNDSSVFVNPSSEVVPDMDLLDILKLKAQTFIKLSEKESREENLKAALATLEFTSVLIDRLRTGYLYEGSKLQLAAKEHENYLLGVSIASSLYDITNDSKYAGIAFRYAEYSKYAVLRELKNDEMAKGVAGIPDSICENERNLKQQIASLRMQVEDESKLEHPNRSKIDRLNNQQFSLPQKLEGLMQRLESNYAAYYKQKHSNETVSVAQLQKAMNKKEAILDYVLGDKELYTFTITKDTFLLVKQETDSAFYSSLNLMITALHSEYSTDYDIYKNAAYALYQKLISPTEPLLEGKNLLIIPDGSLNLIAFDALIDKPYKNGDRLNYSKESFLLKKYPIGYAYSATLYHNSLNNVHEASSDFLGIAPDYKNSKDSLLDVPLGLQGVKRIALLTFGKSLTGNNATKWKFKEYCSRYSIIHFYAHGFDDTLNPANSKLFLTPSLSDSMDEGYLHAWEVYNMQLNAKLVVLASCYSGAGKLSKGEGVLSISRSFMYAGSQSVVMSLWAAAHKPASDILTDFYLNLLKGMRKDEALRLAKLKYLSHEEQIFVHPRFWAGIVVNGNQNKIFNYWFLKRGIVLGVVVSALLLAFWKRKTIKRLVIRVPNFLKVRNS